MAALIMEGKVWLFGGVWWGLVGKHESEEVKSLLVLSEIEVGSY